MSAIIKITDFADERLTPIGYKYGLISEDRYQRFLQKQRKIR
jgi:tRNA uridine 5-carboxymethylaminomethyl modification enzyme